MPDEGILLLGNPALYGVAPAVPAFDDPLRARAVWLTLVS